MLCKILHLYNSLKAQCWFLVTTVLHTVMLTEKHLRNFLMDSAFPYTWKHFSYTRSLNGPISRHTQQHNLRAAL